MALEDLLGQLREEYVGFFASSQPLAVPCLDGAELDVTVRGIPDPVDDPEVEAAIVELLGLAPLDLRQASEQPLVERWAKATSVREIDEYARVNVWRVISPISIDVFRGFGAGPGVYVSLIFHCPWDLEHGLKLTLEGGRTLRRVGPADEFI